MRVLGAVKDAYLNRRILIVIFQVIVQWFVAMFGVSIVIRTRFGIIFT